MHSIVCGPGSSVGIATDYGLDGPAIESRWGERFSAPVQTGPGAHPASCTMGTGSFPGVNSGRSVTRTFQPLLVPWSKKKYSYTSTPPMYRTACTEPQYLYSTAIPLLPLCTVRPVQSLSTCTVLLYLYSPYGPYGLYRASVPVQYSYTSTPLSACTVDLCLYSPYGQYCLYKDALQFFTFPPTQTYIFLLFRKYIWTSYVYWTVYLLDSWIKRDQLDVTCFIISLFNAQNVSDFNTSILRSLRIICWVISWVVLLWFDVCCCYVVVWLGWCGVVNLCRLQPASGYHTIPDKPQRNTNTSNHSNTTHEITQQIIRKLLRMDVLTSETCWALNNEIQKQVTWSSSLFIQLNLNILIKVVLSKGYIINS